MSKLLHSTTGLGLVAMYTITQISTKAAPMKGRAAKERKIEISKLETKFLYRFGRRFLYSP